MCEVKHSPGTLRPPRHWKNAHLSADRVANNARINVNVRRLLLKRSHGVWDDIIVLLSEMKKEKERKKGKARVPSPRSELAARCDGRKVLPALY